MLGQALGRNAPCKEAVRRAQLELGMDVPASTAAFCKARGRVLPSTLEGMSARLSAEADTFCGLDEFSGVWALDGTTFHASDTEENRKEWPYASGPKPGCGFPVVGADGIFRGNDWCRRRHMDDVTLGSGDRLTKWEKR